MSTPHDFNHLHDPAPAGNSFEPPPIDEQLWPVNVALLVLGGLVAGAIIATSSFEDPRLIANGYVRLVTLAATVGGLMWLASSLGNRTLRRAVQFAAVLSLMIHVALIFMFIFLKPEADKDPLAQAPPPEPEIVVNQEFAPEVLDNPDAATEFDKPVDVAPVEAPQEPAAVREQPADAQAPKAAQPAAAPATSEATAQPSSVKEAERREVAPRRGNPSKLSRRAAEMKINPDNPSPLLPEIKNEDQPVAKLEPRDVTMARQQVAAPSSKPNGPGEISVVQRARETPTPTRRETPSAAPELSSMPIAKNRLNEPRALPRNNEQPPLPELAPSTGAVVRDDAPAGPKADALARANAAAPTGGPKTPAAPADKPGGPVAPSPLAPARPEAGPKLASAGARSSRTLTAPVASVDAAAAEGPAGVAPTAVAQQESGPAATALARVSNDRVGAAPISAEAPSESSPRARAIAQAGPQRGQTSEQPTLNPAGRPSARPSRSTLAADVATSAIALDNPTAGVQSGGADQASTGPASTALAKNDTGLTGAGAARNAAAGAGAMGDGLPSTTTLAADHRSGASGSSGGPSRAGGASGGGGGGTPDVAARIAGRSSGRSAPGGGPTISLAADTIADAARAPPGDGGGGAFAAKLEAQGDGPGATRSGDSGGLPIGAMAIEAPRSEGTGVGAGAAQITRAAGSQAEGSGAGMSGLGGGGGGASRASSGGLAHGGPGGGGNAGSSLGGSPAINSLADALPSGGGDDQGAGPQGAFPAIGESSGEAGGDRLAPMAEANAGRGGAGGRGNGPAVSALGAARPGSGVPGDPNDTLAGMAAGDLAIDSSLRGGPGNGVSPNRVDGGGDANAPRVGAVALSGAPGRSNLAGALHGAAGVVADMPDEGLAGGGQADGQGTAQLAPAGESSGGLAELGSRAEAGVVGRRPGSVAVEVAAADGAGGLGAQLASDVGSLDRRARRDGEVVHAGAGRFLGRKVGGTLSIDGRAREPARAFARRGGQRKNSGAGLSEPMQRTEDAVELGLDFLARHQMPEGNWSLDRFGAGKPGYENEQAQFRSDTAATGLALLSFLGAGYDHFDDQYQNTVRGGLEFLVKNQKPNGDLYVAADAESNKSAWLYSHGMATIAMCEAYGMTGDENLREPAQRAINFIIAAQHPSRGGWRYQPQHDADTSVSGWQLMALKSGELSGLTVPPKAYDLARHWLDGAQSGGDHTEFVYNPFAPDTPASRHGRRPTTTITAVGLLMRLYLGQNRDDPLMQRGAEHLAHHLPTLGTRQQPQGDTYYWYYATQVMFHMKGNNWQAWNEKLHPLLVDTQVKNGPMAGSWDPTSDRWGKAAGRIYVTTMNLLSLEVYYRHLPIYESEAK